MRNKVRDLLISTIIAVLFLSGCGDTQKAETEELSGE